MYQHTSICTHSHIYTCIRDVLLGLPRHFPGKLPLIQLVVVVPATCHRQSKGEFIICINIYQLSQSPMQTGIHVCTYIHAKLFGAIIMLPQQNSLSSLTNWSVNVFTTTDVPECTASGSALHETEVVARLSLPFTVAISVRSYYCIIYGHESRCILERRLAIKQKQKQYFTASNSGIPKMSNVWKLLGCF